MINSERARKVMRESKSPCAVCIKGLGAGIPSSVSFAGFGCIRDVVVIIQSSRQSRLV